jgi:hypothetical protein
MPTGEKTLRSLPPHASWVVSAASLNFCTTSRSSPQSVQTYWYVGTEILQGKPYPAARLALASSDC